MSALNSGFIAFAAFISLSIGTNAKDAAKSCLSYEPSVVNLHGTIKVAKAFGAPGYGEDPKHDAKEHYLQLVLDEPICVVGALENDPDAESEHDVRNIQLVFPAKSFNRALLGKPVTPTGKLFHQITGHHHTRVLMTVDSIR